MGNPAFDAAMLLRGLRAMDAALGETYNVLNHTCVPSPVVYPGTFPQPGIDFSKYQGIEGLKGTWRGWLYSEGGSGPLKDSVHPDVEETVVEAFSILERCDKSKEGHITLSEWDACQKGKSAEDQLFDIEYLFALNNVTGKLLVLERDQPLNPANPETYPELIQAREDMRKSNEAHEAQKAGLARERDAAEFQSSILLGTTIGLGATLLTLGARALLRRRAANPTVHPDAQAAIRQQQIQDEGIPPPEARIEAPRPEQPRRAAPAPMPDDLAAALVELENAEASTEGAPPPQSEA